MLNKAGVTLAATLVASSSFVAADLTLEGAKCGQKRCLMTQYCDATTFQCEPCNIVCDTSARNHNFDPELCMRQCQDYIHDIRYEKIGGGGPRGGDMRNIQIQARAALIISSVLLALLLLLCLINCWKFTKNNRSKFTWKYLKKKLQFSKNRVKQYPTDVMHSELPKAAMNEMKLEIRSDKPVVPRRHNHQPLNPTDLDMNRHSHTEKSAGNQTPKTMSTNISNRHPAEDATLDYSYDNKGMNVTPPPIQSSTSHF